MTLTKAISKNVALSGPDLRPCSGIATVHPSCTALWSRSRRYRHRYSGQTQQVACRHGELELQINPSQAAKDGLPNPADSLCPAEVFFDTLAHHLAQSIAGMPGGTPVERTAAAPGVVLSKMGSHTTFAASPHEVDGVERLRIVC